MSPVARPSRRLPARVYWVRRGLLLVLLLLGWGLWRWADGGASLEATTPGRAVRPDASLAAAGTGAANAPAAAAGIGAAVSTSHPHSTDGRPSRTSARPRRVRPVLGEPVAACDPAATTVTPDAGGSIVAGTGAIVQLRLEVAAEQACKLNLGNRLLVQVAKDAQPVWRLAHCPSALSTDTVVLHPGWTTMVDIAWSGRVSNRNCSPGTPSVRPGTYQLQAAMLAGEPDAVDLAVVADPTIKSDRARQTRR